jgi:hypothetical protein
MTGQKLNLEHPRTFNEKMQWLKLYNRNHEYTGMTCKYNVRKIISEKVGEEYLIPLLGVWDTFDDIDFSQLPNQFVLKCTHDSNSVVICQNKKVFNINAAKKKILHHLNQNWYSSSREWQYKNITPRIIAEQYMIDESGTELKDYRVFCFSGEPKLIAVDFGKNETFSKATSHKRNFYTVNWDYLPFELRFTSDSSFEIKKPKNLDQILDFSKKLSNNIPFVRIDWYNINDKIYFGEITFFHASGIQKFSPPEWDKKLGDWLILPRMKKL